MPFPTTEVTVAVTVVDNNIALDVQAPQGAAGPQGATGVGVPAGGLSGYALVKASNADYDTEWAASGGGGGGIWGSITGTLSNQTDLQNALDAKQDDLNPSAGGAAFIADTDIAYASDVLSNTAETGWSIGNNQLVLSNAFGNVILSPAPRSLKWTNTFAGSSGELNCTLQDGTDWQWMTPAASGTLALTVSALDLEITDTTKGVILKSPSGTRYRLQVADDGTLSTTPA